MKEVFDFAPSREREQDKPCNPDCTTVHAYHVHSVWALPRSLAATWGISDLISVPPGTEMVQFPGCTFRTLWIQARMTRSSTRRVTPFGYPRISGCVLLPAASRSLPRPSSYSSSKASTMDPFSLDHIFPLPRYPVELLPPPLSGPRQRPLASPSLRCQWTDRDASLLAPLPRALQRTSTVFSPFPRVFKDHCRSQGAAPNRTLEVWGLEPQTYGLQSHRSSH